MGSVGKFAEEFWNVEAGEFGGWNVVNQRIKDAAKISASCIDFIKQLGLALDSFGRNLQKVAKNSTLPESEYGELRTSLCAAREGVEAWGDDCIGAGTAITQQASALAQHLAHSRLARKRTNQLLKPRQQQVRDSVRKVQQTQRLAQSRMRELVDTQSYKMTLEGRQDTTQREKEKANQSGWKAEEGVREAEGQNREAVTTHNIALEAWCSSATSAFTSMQELEETRVRITRDTLWSIANVCSLLAVHCDKQQENLRSSLLRVDVEGELGAWVTEHRTQQTQPVPLVYTPVSSLPLPAHSFTPSSTPATTPSVRSTILELSDSEDDSEGKSPVPIRKAHALYKFSSRSESEVSLNTGEAVTVMEGSNDEWSLVKTSVGNLGFVPANFISSPSSTKTPEKTPRTKIKNDTKDTKVV